MGEPAAEPARLGLAGVEYQIGGAVLGDHGDLADLAAGPDVGGSDISFVEACYGVAGVPDVEGGADVGGDSPTLAVDGDG